MPRMRLAEPDGSRRRSVQGGVVISVRGSRICLIYAVAHDHAMRSGDGQRLREIVGHVVAESAMSCWRCRALDLRSRISRAQLRRPQAGVVSGSGRSSEHRGREDEGAGCQRRPLLLAAGLALTRLRGQGPAHLHPARGRRAPARPPRCGGQPAHAGRARGRRCRTPSGSARSRRSPNTVRELPRASPAAPGRAGKWRRYWAAVDVISPGPAARARRWPGAVGLACPTVRGRGGRCPPAATVKETPRHRGDLAVGGRPGRAPRWIPLCPTGGVLTLALHRVRSMARRATVNSEQPALDGDKWRAFASSAIAAVSSVLVEKPLHSTDGRRDDLGMGSSHQQGWTRPSLPHAGDEQEQPGRDEAGRKAAGMVTVRSR